MDNPIYTLKENCVGCHVCVHVCPVNANIEDPDFTTSDIALNTTIHINNSRCIQCGSCVKACEHKAREYYDDTSKFFNDLKNPMQKMAVITAPAFLYNFREYKRVLG